MFSKITHQILVTVKPEYDIENSNPSENRFVFRYFIEIENKSKEIVKLLKRKWLIYDEGYGFKEVMGDGIIGIQPELEPGQVVFYQSNVILQSGLGIMQGEYLFQNINSMQEMIIEIPKFHLFSHTLLN